MRANQCNDLGVDCNNFSKLLDNVFHGADRHDYEESGHYEVKMLPQG